MESYGDEIRVQQGEDWNLDKLLSASNREYIPYIVSSERNNPYFVITVASTKYEKNYRYIKSWWCSITDSLIPTFYSTRPILYAENVYPNSGHPDVYPDLPDAPANDSSNPTYGDSKTNPTYGDSKTNRNLYYYTLIDSPEVEPVYDEDTPEVNWHPKYYYFYFEYDENGECLGRVDGYACNVRMNFPSSETSEWGSQNYLYQITLVSGQTMQDKMKQIYNRYHPVDWPDNIEAQYKYVKINYPNELQPDIDIDSPLGYIEAPEVILQPTKLEVFNNLRKLI